MRNLSQASESVAEEYGLSGFEVLDYESALFCCVGLEQVAAIDSG